MICPIRANAIAVPQFIQSQALQVPIRLRPLTADDDDEWNEVRWRNDAWLRPWESGDPLHGQSMSFDMWIRRLRSNERDGTGVVFVMEHQRRIVGQISLGAICYGAMRTGVVGYWVDERCAGRGFAPMAVTLLADWAAARKRPFQTCRRQGRGAFRGGAPRLHVCQWAVARS